MSPLAAAVVLALVHLFAERLRFLHGLPRSRWLSIAGGISVAYVVVHLLPELAEYQQSLDEAGPPLLRAVEGGHIYVLTLVGLVVFYGMELWARKDRGQGGAHDAPAVTTGFTILLYTLYNGVIGYLLVRREGGLWAFAFAMGLHFFINDHALREQHVTAYRRYGRWLVSAAVVLGAAIGSLTVVPEPVVGLLLALIGGGTILNVLKEELPEERESRFGAFVAGAVAYTLVLLIA